MLGIILGSIFVILGNLILLFHKKLMIGRRNTGTMARFALGKLDEKQEATNIILGFFVIILGVVSVLIF